MLPRGSGLSTCRLCLCECTGLCGLGRFGELLQPRDRDRLWRFLCFRGSRLFLRGVQVHNLVLGAAVLGNDNILIRIALHVVELIATDFEALRKRSGQFNFCCLIDKK